MSNELAIFIQSDYFKKNYFREKDKIFTNFIDKICTLVSKLNKVVHVGEKNYTYSFEDFLNSYNIYAKENNLKTIGQYERKFIIKYMNVFNLTSYFI